MKRHPLMPPRHRRWPEVVAGVIALIAIYVSLWGAWDVIDTLTREVPQ